MKWLMRGSQSLGPHWPEVRTSLTQLENWIKRYPDTKGACVQWQARHDLYFYTRESDQAHAVGRLWQVCRTKHKTRILAISHNPSVQRCCEPWAVAGNEIALPSEWGELKCYGTKSQLSVRSIWKNFLTCGALPLLLSDDRATVLAGPHIFLWTGEFYEGKYI